MEPNISTRDGSQGAATFPWTTVALLSLPELTARAGITDQAIRVYEQRHILPRPDITIGGVRRWTVAAADAWIATFPEHRQPDPGLDTAALLANRPATITVDDVDIDIMWDRQWTRISAYDANAWHVEHGTCARVGGGYGDSSWGDWHTRVWIHEGRLRSERTGIGYVRRAWRQMPTWLEGIPDSELGVALRMLADVGKALAAFEQVRADRQRAVLEALRRERDRIAGMPRGHDHAPALVTARQRLEAVTLHLLVEGTADKADILAAAGYDEATARQLLTLAHE